MKLKAILVAGALASLSTLAVAHGVLLDALELAPANVWGLHREVLVVLKDKHGAPIAGAEMTVSADMPSMPMAHNVAKVSTRPGPKPGSYVAAVPFEMKGEWALKVEVQKPTPTSFVRKVVVK
jgi:hypothetical protein